MPPVAKKNKNFKTTKTIKTEKKIKTEPESEPETVISGKSIKMPSVAKKNKIHKAKTIKIQKKIKTESDSEPQTVVSGQLQKQINNNKLKKLPQNKRNRGVVFIKNIPHGFFEEQMRKYFEQFGRVTRLRIARSKRTGNSKGYAYVEFSVPEVAEIAANTMNNYLMFQKIVKTAYIPPEKQKYDYFKTKVRKVINPVGKEIYISNKTKHIAREMRAYNKWDDETHKKRIKSSLKKLNEIKKKCGVDIDFNELINGSVSIKSDNELQNRTDKNDSSAEKSEQKFERIEEKITAETSDSTSEESDSSKCESNLLVKKRKRNKNNTNSSQELKTDSDNKKLKKSLNTSDLKNDIKDEKQSIESSLSKSVSSTSLASSLNDLQNTSSVDEPPKSNDDDDDDYDDDGEDNDMNEMKQNKLQHKKKVTGLDAIIKKKPLLGGIQKAKNLKNKNHKLRKVEKNDQNEKLKKGLIEATLKEMMKTANIKNTNERKTFKKIRKTNKKN